MHCTLSAAQLKSQLIPYLQQFDIHMDSAYIWAHLSCLVGWIYCGEHKENLHQKTATNNIYLKMKEMYNKKDNMTPILTDQQKSEMNKLKQQCAPGATFLVQYGTIKFDYTANIITMEGLCITLLNPWRYIMCDIIPKLHPHILGPDKLIIVLE